MKKTYDFAKEMAFDVKAQGSKSTRDRTLMTLLKLPAIIASGISTDVLLSDPKELCDKLKLLNQQKPAGNISILINERIIAMADKLLEEKCISTKQHESLLLNV